MLKFFRRKPNTEPLPEPLARFASKAGTESITLNALDADLVDLLTRLAAAEGVQTSVFAKKLLLQGLGAYSAARDAGAWKALKLLAERRETF
jgi:hypothetical protein